MTKGHTMPAVVFVLALLASVIAGILKLVSKYPGAQIWLIIIGGALTAVAGLWLAVRTDSWRRGTRA